MPLRRELIPQMRARICELHSLKWGPLQIHKRHPEIPLGSIKTTIRRQALRDDHTSRPRTGRPRALTEEQRDYIYDVVNHTNPQIKMRDLLREVDDVVKKRSLQGLLREIGKKKWLQKNVQHALLIMLQLPLLGESIIRHIL